MVVLLSLSSAAAASPKKKLSDMSAIDLNKAIVNAAVTLIFADAVIKAINPNDVKTDRLEIAKALAPIIRGALYV